MTCVFSASTAQGKTIQAISLVVAHRTDDFKSDYDASRVPTAAAPAKAQGPAKVRIALAGAAARLIATLDTPSTAVPAPMPIPIPTPQAPPVGRAAAKEQQSVRQALQELLKHTQPNGSAEGATCCGGHHPAGAHDATASGSSQPAAAAAAAPSAAAAASAAGAAAGAGAAGGASAAGGAAAGAAASKTAAAGAAAVDPADGLCEHLRAIPKKKRGKGRCKVCERLALPKAILTTVSTTSIQSCPSLSSVNTIGLGFGGCRRRVFQRRWRLCNGARGRSGPTRVCKKRAAKCYQPLWCRPVQRNAACKVACMPMCRAAL